MRDAVRYRQKKDETQPYAKKGKGDAICKTGVQYYFRSGTAPVDNFFFFSARDLQTLSSAVRQQGVYTHLHTHLLLRAVSLLGNRLGTTAETRRRGDTQQHGLFM